jgi:hypothetical protein
VSAASHLQERPLITGPDGQPLWTVRRTRWFLVGLHLPFVAVPALITIAASEDPRGTPCWWCRWSWPTGGCSCGTA